jgi:hypothetical protein
MQDLRSEHTAFEKQQPPDPTTSHPSHKTTVINPGYRQPSDTKTMAAEVVAVAQPIS